MNTLVEQLNLRSQMTPQLRKIIIHCNRVGYITARAALMDYGIGSLSRRICDLNELGFAVTKQERRNPATGQRYVRYYVTWPAEEAA